MSKPEFAYVTYIKTTPDKLWQALTDDAFIRQYWIGCSLSSDWKVGSKMTMSRDGIVKNECTIVDSDPPRRMVYDWRSVFDEAMRNEKPSRVTYEIEPHGEVVKLTVTHQNFAEDSATLPSISFGWPIVLASLKSFVETGRALTIDLASLSPAESCDA